MKHLGTCLRTEREVYYASTKNRNWEKDLPFDNWLVFVISNKADEQLWDQVTEECLNHQVSYICTAGQQCENLHDWFDESILIRRFNLGLPTDHENDFEYEPMTTWHNQFEEGFWFALNTAYDEHVDIDKVICIDLTNKDHSKTLSELLFKINEGWLP
ncbi:MAG: hypothetical protein JJ978_12480 [Roseivirga sp.]|uniref:DUF7684 family protein n=1 Tax=Roseivirga sp. TaxID=1964215 RepID=UPI001B2C7DE5|nr:hypothetical protein [Roseivirga sp.]MBO6496379.1 hypothetical protein [Roseivirga sp.]